MEKKDDIIYDLETSVAEGGNPASPAEASETSTEFGSTDATAPEPAPHTASASETAPEPDEETSPRKEIERMVDEMGAATLLDIIRDNRNAAIRQILREVEASRPSELPSGGHMASECRSIFDLAALA